MKICLGVDDQAAPCVNPSNSLSGGSGFSPSRGCVGEPQRHTFGEIAAGFRTPIDIAKQNICHICHWTIIYTTQTACGMKRELATHQLFTTPIRVGLEISILLIFFNSCVKNYNDNKAKLSILNHIRKIHTLHYNSLILCIPASRSLSSRLRWPPFTLLSQKGKKGTGHWHAAQILPKQAPLCCGKTHERVFTHEAGEKVKCLES